MSRGLAYIRERTVNAFWMLRNGEMRQFVAAIAEEIGHRVNDLRTWWVRVQPEKLVVVRDSGYEDLSRVIPPSPRPTLLRLQQAQPMRADMTAVGAELAAIIETSEIPEMPEQ